MKPLSPLLKNSAAFALLVLVAVTTYSNAMRSGFLMDDHWMFQEDRVGYLHAKIDAVLFHKPIPESLKDFEIDFSYRPLSQLLPMANYLIFRNNMFSYHAVNLALFILCAFMIFLLLQTLFKDFKIALTTALLFTAHPVNSLMVNYISAHIFSVQLLLMITCCLTYLSYHKNSKNYLSLMISLAAFYLATLCHELALALPLFLAWMTLTVLDQNFKNSFKKLLPFYGLGLILSALWLFQTLHTNEMFLYKEKLQISWFIYAAGLAQLWTWYITKLIFLDGVLLMYVIPAGKISVLYGWMVITATTVILIFTKHLWSKDKHVVWGLGWFAIALLAAIPGARFQPAYGMTVEPHWLYFGSLGLFLITAKGLNSFAKYSPRLPFILIMFLTIGYGLATFRLNHIWADPIVYGEYFLAQNPDFEKARIFLASAYFREGLYSEVKKIYLPAFEEIPSEWMPYNNLGIIADINGDYDEAVGYFQKILADHPDLSGVLSNLAIVYTKTGELEKAENLLQRAVDLNPWLLTPRLNLAQLYLKQKKFKEAVQILQKNIEISPDDQATLNALHEAESRLKENPSP